MKQWPWGMKGGSVRSFHITSSSLLFRGLGVPHGPELQDIAEGFVVDVRAPGFEYVAVRVSGVRVSNVLRVVGTGEDDHGYRAQFLITFDGFQELKPIHVWHS